MPESPLESAGAAVQPIAAAPLHTNEFFTGMWTQGNPLGPGAVPYLYQKFYSATRFDRLVGGLNVEITTRLTLARRPGSSVYNPGPFPPINRFYEWRGFSSAGENIRIMASCDAPGGGAGSGTVRDVTGPATDLVIQNKAANAGRTSFVSVGNDLYWGDGAETGMLTQTETSWAATTQYNPGDMIVDPKGNVQRAMGAQTATITNIQVDDVTGAGGTHLRKVSLFFSAAAPLDVLSNIALTLAGLTTVPSQNGTTTATVVVQGATQVYYTAALVGGNPPVTPYSPETGTATTGTGISGATAPAWNATPGLVTQDGGNQWVNMGPAAQSWGIAAPTIAPTVTQTTAPSVYPAWAADTWYSPNFVILDSNNNLQQLTGPATGAIKTGSAAPAWLTAVGAVTIESAGGGNAHWTCLGPSAWAANQAYAVGNAVLATYTYTITVPVIAYTWNGYTNVPTPTMQTQQVTATSLFVCLAAGTSGASAPSWVNGIGTTTTDGGATWQNTGTAPAWPGAGQTLSLAVKVMDTNNNVEVAQETGESGAAAPTWNTGKGAYTDDGNQVWLNAGPYGAGNTDAWQWAYSGKNSATGQISTASPLSVPLTTSAGKVPVVQGPGLPFPPYDTIVLWRTLEGGSVLFYDDEFPNPGAGQTWVYTDANADADFDANGNPLPATVGQLNPFIEAPIAGANDPPPPNFIPQCYYLGRIWGFVGNVLKWTNGPDTVVGNGDESMAALNEMTFPATGVTCWPTSMGLIVFTLGDIWIVLGQGTPSSPFYAQPFQKNVALASQDAFSVQGSTGYGMLTSGQVMSMDPGAGELEVGFPIGNILDGWTAADAYLAWHQAASADSALYVADGAAGWFRMAPVAAPESGNVWSPYAGFAGGIKAIASLETAPGERALLMGPAANNGPILMRSRTTYQDDTTPFDCFAQIGSIVMCQPGNTVGVQYITTEELPFADSVPVSVAVLFDEIDGGYDTLRNVTNDPPNLPQSETVTARRFWMTQDAETVPKCRHMRVKMSWPAEDIANELLTYTIYGRLPEKARK